MAAVTCTPSPLPLVVSDSRRGGRGVPGCRGVLLIAGFVPLYDRGQDGTVLELPLQEIQGPEDGDGLLFLMGQLSMERRLWQKGLTL